MPNVIALPSLPSMVPAVRVAVRNLLRGSPRVDDAESIASELVTNAILYTTSGSGKFSLSIDVRPGWMRIEASDGDPYSTPTSTATPTSTPGTSPDAHSHPSPPSPPPPHPYTSPYTSPHLSQSPPPPPQPPSPPPPPSPSRSPRPPLTEDSDADYGRGLTIIRTLSDRWGHDRYPDHSVWWAELVWTEPSDANG